MREEEEEEARVPLWCMSVCVLSVCMYARAFVCVLGGRADGGERRAAKRSERPGDVALRCAASLPERGRGRMRCLRVCVRVLLQCSRTAGK